jgi:MFS family permease
VRSKSIPPIARAVFDVKQPALFPITLIVFVDVLGLTVVIPLLPFYAETMGASPATVGALIATYAAGALFAGPLLGRWSDRWGRKPILMLSQLGSLIGFVMLALAPSLLWLFLGRALDGLSAGNLPVARAYIADVTAPKDRSAAFGLIAAAFGFGYMVGPAGAALLSGYGHQAPLWAAALLSATSLLCTALMLPGVRSAAGASPPAPLREVIAAPGVTRRLAQWFAFLGAFSLFTAGFALFCERRLQWNGAAFGPTEVGLVLAYIGALGLLAQLTLLRPLVSRYGETRIVHAGLLCAAAGYAVLALARDLPTLLVALSLSGIANSLLRPALLGLISQAVPATRQGVVFGVTQSLQSLAMIIAPLAAGGLIHFGWLGGWALACAVVVGAARLFAPRPVLPAG